MNDTKQIWQQSKEEFGERAFERFDAESVLESNNQAENLIECDFIIQLKPIAELFAHDVEVYGENAYLMWSIEDFHYDDMTLCDADDNDDVINNDPNIVRKTSAALPFDLERAKAGDVVEWLNLGEWKTLSKNEFSVTFEYEYSNGTKVIQSNPSIPIFYNLADLRMKYLPKVAR